MSKLKEKFAEKQVEEEFESEEQRKLKEKIIGNLEALHYSRAALREIWKIVQRKWQN